MEQAAPAVNEALEHMENSTRQLRGYHFKGILWPCWSVASLSQEAASLSAGRSFRVITRLKVKAALERVVSVNATNEETFTQLTKMNVPIRVVPVVDNRKQAIPRKFALVVDHAEDVGIEEMGDGKRAAIYFEQSSY